MRGTLFPASMLNQSFQSGLEVAASRPGARGEGVCVLVHPDIAHGAGLWRFMPSAAGLWLVLKPAVTGAASDVYLGGVYIRPAQSGLLRTSSASDRFAALTGRPLQPQRGAG